MTTEDSLRNRAYHEAGHAVAAIALGREIELLSIDKDGVSGGRCREKALEPPDDELTPDDLDKRLFEDITIEVAGPLAQCSECGGETDRIGASNDLRTARESALRLARGNWNVAFLAVDKAVPRADHILKEHAEALNALATALLERTELTGGEVHEIMPSDKG